MRWFFGRNKAPGPASASANAREARLLDRDHERPPYEGPHLDEHVRRELQLLHKQKVAKKKGGRYRVDRPLAAMNAVRPLLAHGFMDRAVRQRDEVLEVSPTTAALVYLLRDQETAGLAWERLCTVLFEPTGDEEEGWVEKVAAEAVSLYPVYSKEQIPLNDAQSRHLSLSIHRSFEEQ